MTRSAIRVENLGKQYQLGLREKRHQTFREMLTYLAGAPLRRLRYLSGKDGETEQIWALRDVSFDIQPGEVMGVIGPNGAGKTTLLRILTRITEPTTGRAEVRGRVASLLEVGTGFHPELTGRENVWLNGAILGMPRAQIKSKFEEIVDFSGVEKFLDTPVKRYSSGMRVRLAFAVAAHLDPEVLLIDEVLAVGDVEFQKKCLGKMGDVARDGRTVVFVSHNMGAVADLCTRVVRLADGRIAGDGDPTRIIADYENAMCSRDPSQGGAFQGATLAFNSGDFELRNVTLNGTKNGAVLIHPPLQGFTFDFHCFTSVSLDRLKFSFGLINDRGHCCIWEQFEGRDLDAEISSGNVTLRVTIPPIPLSGGRYGVNFGVKYSGTLEKLCHFKNIGRFSAGTRDGVTGILAVPIRWECRKPPGDLHDT